MLMELEMLVMMIQIMMELMMDWTTVDLFLTLLRFGQKNISFISVQGFVI